MGDAKLLRVKGIVFFASLAVTAGIVLTALGGTADCIFLTLIPLIYILGIGLSWKEKWCGYVLVFVLLPSFSLPS